MLKPKVGIIYLTYNGPDSVRDITRCFQTLEKITYPRENIELICVENPSKHGASWPFIESDWRPKVGVSFPNLTIIKNPQDLGYSGANNVGLQAAIDKNCDYVFLLNQDTDVDANFLTAVVERAEQDPSVMFVQSVLMLGQDKNLVNSLGNRYHFLGFGYAGGMSWTKAQADDFFAKEKLTNPDLEIPYFSGGAVLVRTSLAKDIGLFDTAFYMYHEDVDASFNARVRGYKTVVEPTSIVYHYYEFSRSIKKFYWMERNRMVVLLSYYKWQSLLLLAPVFLAVELASFMLSIKSGWWREKLRAYVFFLKASTWKWIKVRRTKIQAERKITDAELLKIATGEILFQDSPGTNAADSKVLTDVKSDIVTRIGNPILKKIWSIFKPGINW